MSDLLVWTLLLQAFSKDATCRETDLYLQCAAILSEFDNMPGKRMETIKRTVVAYLCLSLCNAADLLAADHSPNQFEHHPKIKVELFAMEPQVVDPVCVAFAANGDCIVVEMRDYPYGFGERRNPGGTIRLLRDTDQDGRADSSHLFAKGLSFPTSVMPWRDGVLVLAPPQILFLKDTNGDDKSDVTKVVLDGLRLGVTDSNANSLRFGVDGLVHVANGGNGGTVWLADKPDQRTKLGNWDFAIDFDNDRIVKTGETGGGFGLVFDEAGNSFTTYNIDYLQQRVIAHDIIANSPEVFSFDATENISDHGESARIYPIVQAETRVNHPEQAGHFSSAGGMGLLESGPLHAQLSRSIFVCDVVCNVVHRDLLRPDGAAFRASRAPEEQNREFIASRDPAFRPIGFEHGPDGAMYLVDMQRDVIEHPDYIPERVLEGMNVRGGENRGRIYRVTPSDGLPTAIERLHAMSVQRLVELLSSEHRWQAETAHRLLADRVGDSAETEKEISRRLWASDDLGTDSGRVRSLWLLDRIGKRSESILDQALVHPSPIVRKTAIQLMPRRDHSIHLRDPDLGVQFHAALSLDGVRNSSKLSELSQIFFRCRDKWMRRAVLLAVDDEADKLLYATTSHALSQGAEEAICRVAIREAADVAAAGLQRDSADEFRDWLKVQLSQKHAFVPDLLRGINAGWERRPQSVLPAAELQPIVREWIQATEAKSSMVEMLDLMITCKVTPPKEMQALVGKMLWMAMDTTAETADRTRAINIASRAATLGVAREPVSRSLIAIVESPETSDLHESAIDGLRRMQDASTAKILCERWSSISPGIRVDLIKLLLSRREYHSVLLTAVENDVVKVGELNLDLEQRRTLLRESSDEVGRRAAKLFGDEEYSNRKMIVREWLDKLPDVGDSSHGMKIYKTKCATCHVSRGEGHRVGPDLQAMSHRSVEDLLTHILDPNMSINPNYVSCVVHTTDGLIVDGLLKKDSPESVTLIKADAIEQTIPRSKIETFRTLAISLMPEGLEKDLKPSDLRSLIAYLQEKP